MDGSAGLFEVNEMDYGTLIGNSFAYVKEGVIDKVNKWLLLIIATLILFIPLMGYILSIYRGTNPAPEVENWSKLIVDGILLLIVGIIYAIPVIILEFLTIGMAIATMKSNPGQHDDSDGWCRYSWILLVIVAILIWIISPIGIIRFARQRQAVGRLGMAVASGIEIDAHPLAFAQSTRAVVLGGEAVAVHLPPAGLGIHRVQVHAMRAGHERHGQVIVGPQLDGRAGLADSSVIARPPPISTFRFSKPVLSSPCQQCNEMEPWPIAPRPGPCSRPLRVLFLGQRVRPFDLSAMLVHIVLVF